MTTPITLDWQVCPDGVRAEFDVEGTERYFGTRSTRRTARSYDVADLSSPIVLAFLNSDTVEQLENFFAAYGLLDPVCTEKLVTLCKNHLAAAVHVPPLADHPEGVATLNSLLEPVSLKIGFDYLGQDQSLRMVIKAGTLFDLMCAEVAMAAQVGAALTRCENCNRLFYTGHLTGRRSTARFCSDRCRMAALRRRAMEAK